MKKHNIKSIQGFSVIEGVIAAGIVALSILSIAAIVSQHSTMAKSSVAKQELPGIGTDVLNRTRAALLETAETSGGLKTKGICSLLEPKQIKPGIQPIDLVTTKARLNTAFSLTVWKKVFAPEWSVSDYKVSDRGEIKISLAPVQGRNTLATSQAIDFKTLQVDLSISIRTMDPTKSSAVFSLLPMGLQRVDSKTAVFMVEAVTNYDRILDNGERSKRSADSKDLISVLDVGSCDVRDANGVILSMSPAGTGVGDPSGRTIYNNTIFEESGVSPFEISFSATEVVQGRYIDGRLSADRTKNVVAACTETRFRCPARNHTRDYKPFINVTAFANYFSKNKYGYRERVRVSPKMEFLDTNGKNILNNSGTSIEYTNSATTSYRQHSNQLFYPIDAQGGMDTSAPMSFSPGGNGLKVKVNNAEPLCRKVCSETNPISARPSLTVSTPDFLDNEDKWAAEIGAASMPLHCTMCFVKGCTRMGLETFGPLNELPPEPLDAQIPECAAENKDEAEKILPYAEQNITLAGGGRCISAKVENGKLIYQSRNCNDKLPAMCFAFGEYTLARTLGTSTIPSVSFAEAPDACRNMGRESHPVTQLREGILQQGGSVARLDEIPKASNRYQFLNLAKMGFFVSPQGEEESTRAASDLKKSFGSKVSSEFWTALKVEDAGVVADVPRAMLSNDVDQRHMLYYSPAGVQTHTVVSETPYSYVRAPASGGTAYVLFNHVKFRGVVPVASEQTSSHEFLCQNKSGAFFVTRGKSSQNFADGGNACESSNGFFVAPHSSSGWLSSLMAVAPHGNYYPFPELASEPRAVWVALQGPHLAPALQGEFSKLAFKKPGFEELSQELVDRDGAFIEARRLLKKVKVDKSNQGPQSSPQAQQQEEFEWVPDPSVKIKVACYSSRNRNIAVRDIAQGCGTDEDRLLEADLQKPLISMLWVMKKSNFDLGYLDFIKVKP
ncbi:hypothetical protein ACLWBD_14480 [Bdellovibrio sp. HCB117]|uniref:hypothetical protein n=1 Tax=Bdellovibrio sp. HCB117 TaxID=3394359 RepID=UPI0039B547DC